MLHWYERAAMPILGGGLVWIYGVAQQQGSGFRIFVRYAAIWCVGIFTLIGTNDLLEKLFSGAALSVGFVWTALVGFTLWKRHLK